ncbi:hypothetical protein D3C71_1407480 [compost metagenome]
MPVCENELADLKQADIDVAQQKLPQARVALHFLSQFDGGNKKAMTADAHDGFIRCGFCAQKSGPAGDSLPADEHGFYAFTAIVMNDGGCQTGFDETEMRNGRSSRNELISRRQIDVLHPGREP